MATKIVAEPQPFAVRRSGIQGKGAFATRPIRKGERVAEYVGERITWKAADERYDDGGMKRHHTFLFSVNSRTVIDAAVGGNDARFINHSCAPNCEAVDEKGRIFIEAIKPIPEGAELFYDYAYARDKDTSEEDEKLYVCLCGSPKCRGTILEPRKKAKRAAPHHAAARHPHEHVAGKSQPGGAKGARKRGGAKGKAGSTDARRTKAKAGGKGGEVAKRAGKVRSTGGTRRSAVR